jgi:predicted dehydrogenase
VTFKSGQVLSIRNSWAEMNEREVVSVVFQGQKAGGKIQRLFRVEGIDATSIDSCELYTQENGFPVNRTIIVEADETMGRTRSAKNFALVLEGREAPLNVASEALTLMKIIDGIYASATSGRPVEIG